MSFLTIILIETPALSEWQPKLKSNLPTFMMKTISC